MDRRRARWQAIGYYSFGVLWLAALVAIVIVRIRTSSESASQLTTGLVVLACVLSAGIVITTLTTLPSAVARAELRRRYPHALVENVQRNPLRPSLAAIAPEATNEGGWYRTVVADEVGLAIWRRLDRSTSKEDRLDCVASIRWTDVRSMQIHLRGMRQPMWSIDVLVSRGSAELEMNLVFSAQALGGLFPAGAAASARILEDLERRRASAITSA